MAEPERQGKGNGNPADIRTDIPHPARVYDYWLGSYLVLSHATDEFAPERTHQTSVEAAQRGAIWIPRGKDDILRMFNGLELLDPGLVPVSYWRPEGGVPDPNADRAWVYGGVARV